MKHIFLLTGYKGSGKDTAARIIAEHVSQQGKYRVSKFAFATLLKDVCEMILVRCGLHFTPEHFIDPQLKETFITYPNKEQVIFKGDKNQNYSTLTYRKLLQLVGTELFRDLIHSDIWLMPAHAEIDKMIDNDILLITDTRFTNEYIGILRHVNNRKDFSIHLIGINRNSQHNTEHASEVSIGNLLNGPNCIIIGNNGSMKLFEHNVIEIYQSEIEKSLTKLGGRDGRKKKNA
jgi:hypothetical protein